MLFALNIVSNNRKTRNKAKMLPPFTSPDKTPLRNSVIFMLGLEASSCNSQICQMHKYTEFIKYCQICTIGKSEFTTQKIHEKFKQKHSQYPSFNQKLQ